jgi:hypothetical protein
LADKVFLDESNESGIFVMAVSQAGGVGLFLLEYKRFDSGDDVKISCL